MKKLSVIALISLLCFACTDDPQELFIKKTELSLYPEEVIQIDAVSDFDITYLSANTYLANISAEGMLRANKVGKTRVEVSSHERVAEIAVEVKGRYNLYPDPIIDWGISQSDLIARAGEPDESYVSTVQYANYSDQATGITYLFDAEDALMCTMVIVDNAYFDDLIAYMNERFVYNSEEEGLHVFCNANKEEDASMLIGIFEGNVDSLMVLYIENQKYETKTRQSVATYVKNVRKQMKLIASENMNELD